MQQSSGKTTQLVVGFSNEQLWGRLRLQIIGSTVTQVVL